VNNVPYQFGSAYDFPKVLVVFKAVTALHQHPSIPFFHCTAATQALALIN
jgi:hypothetical protein